MADPLLVMENVHKKFGELEVLSGVDLVVNRSDVVSIIGSSGSGKTTLLRCINLLEDFHEGRILIDGEPIGYKLKNGKRQKLPNSLIARHRALTGMVFQ